MRSLGAAHLAAAAHARSSRRRVLGCRPRSTLPAAPPLRARARPPVAPPSHAAEPSTHCARPDPAKGATDPAKGPPDPAVAALEPVRAVFIELRRLHRRSSNPGQDGPAAAFLEAAGLPANLSGGSSGGALRGAARVARGEATRGPKTTLTLRINPLIAALLIHTTILEIQT